MFSSPLTSAFACFKKRKDLQAEEVVGRRRDRLGAPRTTAALIRGFVMLRAEEEEKEEKAKSIQELEEERERQASRFCRVVVGGGTGFIGGELVRHLRRKGFDVIVLARPPRPSWLDRMAGEKEEESGREPPEEKEYDRWQPEKRTMTWDELETVGFPEGTRAVVNLAGRNFLDPLRRWTAEFKKEVYDSRVETARAVARAIEKTEAAKRPEVFVQISGVGFYPADGGERLYDEWSSGGGGRGGGDPFAELARDWEAAAALSPLGAAWSTRQVVVRSGVVLGRTGGLVRKRRQFRQTSRLKLYVCIFFLSYRSAASSSRSTSAWAAAWAPGSSPCRGST